MNSLNDRRGSPIRTIVWMLLVGTLVAGCFGPFEAIFSEDDKPREKPPYGSLVVNPSQLGASTVAPDLANLKNEVASYTVLLTNFSPGHYDDILTAGYVEGNPITNIPVPSSWNATLDAFDGGGQRIAVGTLVSPAANPVSTPNVDPVAVTMRLGALQFATGEFDYSVDWSNAAAPTVPEVEVHGVEVSLHSYASGLAESHDITSSGTISLTNLNVSPGTSVQTDFDTGTVNVSDATMDSGFYRLRVQPYRLVAEVSPPYTDLKSLYAPVIEILHIYDYLASAATIQLAPGNLTAPPAAPSNLTATITAGNAFTLAWTDNSNTEEGFRIYEGALDAEPEHTVDASVTSATSVQIGYAGNPGDTMTYNVTSFNNYGNSVPATVVFTVPESGETGITIENPTVFTITIVVTGDTGSDSVLDRTLPETWALSVAVTPAHPISSYEWLLNNTVGSTDAGFSLAANDPLTKLGGNTLTLIVSLDGILYLENLMFNVVGY